MHQNSPAYFSLIICLIQEHDHEIRGDICESVKIHSHSHLAILVFACCFDKSLTSLPLPLPSCSFKTRPQLVHTLLALLSIADPCHVSNDFTDLPPSLKSSQGYLQSKFVYQIQAILRQVTDSACAFTNSQFFFLCGSYHYTVPRQLFLLPASAVSIMSGSPKSDLQTEKRQAEERKQSDALRAKQKAEAKVKRQKDLQARLGPRVIKESSR